MEKNCDDYSDEMDCGGELERKGLGEDNWGGGEGRVMGLKCRKGLGMPV